MALTVLQYKTNQTCLANDRKFCQQIYKYISWIANEKIEVLRKNKALRLPIANVNSKTLKKFDVKIIAKRQKQMAPLIILLLKVAARLDSMNDNAFDSNNEPIMELNNQMSEKKSIHCNAKTKTL